MTSSLLHAIATLEFRTHGIVQTLFRSPDVGMTRAVGLSTFNVRYKLNCVSLWLCLVYLGVDEITARLQYYVTLVSSDIHPPSVSF